MTTIEQIYRATGTEDRITLSVPIANVRETGQGTRKRRRRKRRITRRRRICTWIYVCWLAHTQNQSTLYMCLLFEYCFERVVHKASKIHLSEHLKTHEIKSLLGVCLCIRVLHISWKLVLTFLSCSALVSGHSSQQMLPPETRWMRNKQRTDFSVLRLEMCKQAFICMLMCIVNTLMRIVHTNSDAINRHRL